MSDAYDVTSFELDYCEADISKIATAIKAKASLLVIGMPGCGKSRLIDFLFHRPGVLEKYGLPTNLKLITIDSDIVADDPHGIYTELWQALGTEVNALDEGSLNVLKNKLVAQVRKLERDVDLIVVFDNFNGPLQKALGENFFNFLYALRNSRPKLNISYIFMANLNIDFSAFHKADRLFDKGVDHSICWLSLLSQKDTFFSIERQWRKTEENFEVLTEADRERTKQRIYELAGGHALLTRYLSHLMLSGEVSIETKPEKLLEHRSIRSACTAIWDDLEQKYKIFLIDMAHDGGTSPETSVAIQETLTKYGILKEQAFFSPIFESFVEGQQKTGEVVNVSCDGAKSRIIIKTVDDELLLPLNRKSLKKEGLLSLKARSLLCYLLANEDEVCTRDQLIKIAWPLDHEGGVSNQALDRQIERIRIWLKEQPQLSPYLVIETAQGTGYKLVIKG